MRRPESGEGGHHVDTPLSSTVSDNASTSGALRIIFSPSRSHCTTAPAMNTLPSSAYSVRPSIFQATVVRRLFFDGTASVPVLSSMKQPVP